MLSSQVSTEEVVSDLQKKKGQKLRKKENQNECISTIKGAFEVCSADTLG